MRAGTCLSAAITYALATSGFYSPAAAQTATAAVVITLPKYETLDENHVSLFTGKIQMTINALSLGDVSFTPYSYNGPHFARGGVYDQNYGNVYECSNISDASYIGITPCAGRTPNPTIQAALGQERASFTFNSSTQVYTPEALDGSSFTDTSTTDGFCTWIKKDGTKVVYYGHRPSGDPLCIADAVAKIVQPSGRTLTYYYYGTPSVTAPILSIASNTGYMLKYIYSGTPVFGSETSVVAINRAFETCDPAALSCTLTNTWPTATLLWQDIPFDDGFFQLPDEHHHIFTLQDQSNRKYIFELDNNFRIITYQPPEATAPVYTFQECWPLRSQDGSTNYPLSNCGAPGGTWNPQAIIYRDAQLPTLFFDDVWAVIKNGQTWTYNHDIEDGCQTPPMKCSIWSHWVRNPLGRYESASGNSTPGLEHEMGPTGSIGSYDGSVILFEQTVANPPVQLARPLGGAINYTFDEDITGGRVPRYNLTQTTDYPNPGSGTTGTIVKKAHYTTGCSSIVSCNKPDYAQDANNNQTDYTYDAAHGGLLTETGPAVYSASAGGNVRPQKRYTYVQRHAWYYSASGALIQDPNAVWLLATESYCRLGAAAASGVGCALANDEVLTTYDYGPDDPLHPSINNLMLRGQVVTSGGQKQRVCFAHDKVGNKIWEVSPNANVPDPDCTTFLLQKGASQ